MPKGTQSILQRNNSKCYLCGEEANYVDGNLDVHHIFPGTANRKKSEQYGLKVRLHHNKCHQYGPDSVHRNREVAMQLMIEGQRAFEELYGDRDFFRKEFGKSYL
jgi:hypothetical protein